MNVITMKMTINRLAFRSLYIKETANTCIFIVGDMNADISNEKSLFGQHLEQFCQDSKMILSSKVLLSADSHRHISESWAHSILAGSLCMYSRCPRLSLEN